jgi:hypothetical protein
MNPAARRDHAMTSVPKNWQEMSLGRLWDELNNPQQFRTPQTTIEAILFCVKERGIEALNEPANVERLDRCDMKAKEIIKKRIAALRQKGVLP